MRKGKPPKRPSRRAPARPARARATPSPAAGTPDDTARLRAELREVLERQTAISEILRSISGLPADLAPVLQAIAQNAVRFCAAEDAFVMVLDGSELRTMGHFGPIGWSIGATWPLDRGFVAGRAFLDRTVVHVRDMQSESPQEYPIATRVSREGGFRTMLAAPLMREGTAIGVIVLRRREVRPFSDQQIELLKTFAEPAAIAIENVRLFNETKEALERQTAIAEILGAISSSPATLQPVFEAIASASGNLCRADHSVIFLRQEDGLRLVEGVRWIAEGARTADAAGRAYLASLTLTDRTSWGGRAFVEGRTVHLHDMVADEEIDPELKRRFGEIIRTALAVPLRRGSEIIGTISLTRTRIERYSQREIELVETFAQQAVIAIENVRLFNETKEALEQQTATSEVLRVIARSQTDLQPVFDSIAESAVRFCSAEDAIVMLREGDLLRGVAHYGPMSVLESGPIPIERGRVSGVAILERRVVHVPDVFATDEFPVYRSRPEPQRTMLAAPLVGPDGEPAGTILLRRAEARPFADRQIELLKTFADQAVIAIENVRLFNETKEALERQTAIAETLQTMGRSRFDLQPVLDAVIEHAARLCHADWGFLDRLEGDFQRRVAVSSGAPEDERAVIGSGTQISRWNFGRAILERRPITGNVAELLREPGLPDRLKIYLAEHPKFRTALAVPLITADRPLGVMGLHRSTDEPFSAQEVALVRTFADQAVIAIENVRLFNETKEALERQTAVSDVLQTISRSAFDLQPVLDTVVENAARLSDADAVWMTKVEGGDLVISTLARHGHSADGRDLDLRLQEPPPRAGRHTEPASATSIMGRPVVDRRTVMSVDLQNDPGLRDSTWALGIGARSVLGVPMIREGLAIGVLVVARHEVRPFTEREIKLVETFADQAAIAMENVRLFNEIQDKSSQLEVASRHKSEFLANMSHELRTPLNAIIGFTDVMLQEMFGPLNEKQKEYLEDVRGSGTHLLTLINDILDLSKIEAGRVDLEPTEFSVAQAIDEALVLVRERATRYGITLAANVSPDVGRIVADERKVKQIVVNLLSNAVKFTPEGGWVGITATCDGDHVHVAVRDTGIGIAPQDQERVFEEFRQVGKDPERSREGTGLGLTLAQRFVELHGGRIRVESEVGKGSTFTFTIPVRQTAPTPAS